MLGSRDKVKPFGVHRYVPGTEKIATKQSRQRVDLRMRRLSSTGDEPFGNFGRGKAEVDLRGEIGLQRENQDVRNQLQQHPGVKM